MEIRELFDWFSSQPRMTQALLIIFGGLILLAIIIALGFPKVITPVSINQSRFEIKGG